VGFSHSFGLLILVDGDAFSVVVVGPRPIYNGLQPLSREIWRGAGIFLSRRGGPFRVVIDRIFFTAQWFVLTPLRRGVFFLFL